MYGLLCVFNIDLLGSNCCTISRNTSIDFSTSINIGLHNLIINNCSRRNLTCRRNSSLSTGGNIDRGNRAVKIDLNTHRAINHRGDTGNIDCNNGQSHRGNDCSSVVHLQCRGSIIIIDHCSIFNNFGSNNRQSGYML